MGIGIAIIVAAVAIGIIVSLIDDIKSLRCDINILSDRIAGMDERLKQEYYTKQAVSRMVSGSPVDRPNSPEHDLALEEELRCSGEAGHSHLPVVEHITGELVTAGSKE